MLMDKTRDDGILCYHISSRYYNMTPIIATVADELKYASLVGRDDNGADHQRGHFTSNWIMVSLRRRQPGCRRSSGRTCVESCGGRGATPCTQRCKPLKKT